ncbi:MULTISPECIES: ABC transporter permease [Streptomyces]|uniref:Transport permease protein n=1 Tax=Streptomyces doudnae TaxID=3075536 RepID=A0ABD5EF36_9ACTN|nr:MULTISPECIES: ABC transporter permease [unclassified Streptomyces]MDT0433206.1 ABC transporter permease [Streptomyces sp. DSM 41981]MYQ68114.1 ABC transporter permease [Streptomyces sp. SID4950]SCE43171.1 ABC-type polysaccharide/polyol phosphate export permease [Streptomyces sp. SolWspMP-5a-2]
MATVNLTAHKPTGPVGTIRDGLLIAERNLLNLRRTPGAVVAALVQPLMFVLLLAYVFGGSLGGAEYRSFLMGGIFAQAVTFNASFTAIGLAADMDKGMVDRFRALPMPRGSVILGRTLSDLTMSAVTLTVTSLCGLLIGWRLEGSALDAVVAYGLVLLFAFAMSWIGATIGLMARSVEVAQSAGLIWLFPVTFVSGAFVSVTTMPEPLRTIAEWNPVSATATAARSLFGNQAPPAVVPPDSWPVQHATAYALLCACAIIALFMPLAVARYRRIARG